MNCLYIVEVNHETKRQGSSDYWIDERDWERVCYGVC
jgi:hypothetical protein